MRSTPLVLISAVTLAGLFACTRGPAAAGPSAGCTRAGCTRAAAPRKESGDASASWRVSCRELCDVSASAGTPEALCARAAGPDGACIATRTFTLDAPRGAALTEGALLDVRRGEVTTSALAIRTQSGWRLVRGLGARVRLGSATLADLPGIAPPAVSVRVVDDDAAATERLYVCGVRGDGSVDCPIAIVSGAPSWRVDVKLDGDRFSARPAFGDVPASFHGLVGEHAIFEQR